MEAHDGRSLGVSSHNDVLYSDIFMLFLLRLNELSDIRLSGLIENYLSDLLTEFSRSLLAITSLVNDHSPLAVSTPLWPVL